MDDDPGQHGRVGAGDLAAVLGQPPHRRDLRPRVRGGHRDDRQAGGERDRLRGADGRAAADREQHVGVGVRRRRARGLGGGQRDVVGLLYAGGLVRAYVPVAIALTTTALGTLLPILRENHLLGGRLGAHLLAAGAIGELLPIIAVALFLGTTDRWVALISLVAVAAVAFGLTLLSRWFRIDRIRTFIEESEHETTQLTVRGTVLLLTLLLAVTEQFHLDAVLGAFMAGMVLRRWAGRGLPALEGKLDALGYGFFIPIFFVYSGMSMDLRSMVSAPLRVLMFAVLMLLVHVVAVQLLYRRVLDARERWQMALVTSTALPLLVAISEIGLRNGTMLPENAAALVGAGVLTVLVFPALAVVLRRPPIVSGAPIP